MLRCLWASPLLNLGGSSPCLPHCCCSPTDVCLLMVARARTATRPGVPRHNFFSSSFFFPPLCINLVSFNLITFFSDRLSQEQCKWALKRGDLVYICQLIAWVAQTTRAGTCLFALRFTFDFRSDAVPRRRSPDREQGCSPWAVFCPWLQWSQFLRLDRFYTFGTEHRSCVLMQSSVRSVSLLACWLSLHLLHSLCLCCVAACICSACACWLAALWDVILGCLRSRGGEREKSPSLVICLTQHADAGNTRTFSPFWLL